MRNASELASRAARQLTNAAARFLGAGARIDGRIVVVSALAVYLGAVVVAWFVFGANLWPRLGVWAAETPFFDARNITAAVECRALGYDPLIANPCDPAGRPMNYPRVWLVLGLFGADQSWTGPLGVAFTALYLIALYRLIGRITVGHGVVLAVAICSPAAMLAVERGQSALVLFALLAGAVLLWRRGGDVARVASPMVVLAAAVLKLFPAFVLGGYLLARQRRAAAAAVACLLAFAIYAAAIRDDIRAMAAALPQQRGHSYGAHILFSRAFERLGMADLAFGPAPRVLGAAGLLLLTLAAYWWWRRRWTQLGDDPGATISWEKLAFHIGALVYLGSFGTVSNWDYRLIFLLFAVPQLVGWITDAHDERRYPATATLPVLLVTLYSGNLLVDELANWLLAGLLLWLVMPSVHRAWAWFAGRERRTASAVDQPMLRD